MRPPAVLYGLGIPGIGYHEPSDRRSWHSTLRLFAETIDT